MTKPVALVTNALAFAGPPAVNALLKAGFQVVVHDLAFISFEFGYMGIFPKHSSVEKYIPCNQSCFNRGESRATKPLKNTRAIH